MNLRYPAAVAVLLLAGASAPASAETRFALTCIGTDTSYTIYYQYRWGEKGEWKDTSVDPGKWKNHTWDYDYPGEDASPTFMIRYDDDLSDGENFTTPAVANGRLYIKGRSYLWCIGARK